MGLSVEQTNAYMTQTLFGATNAITKKYKSSSSSNGAATYEKSVNYKSPTYNIKDMTDSDRSQLVQKLKEEQAQNEQKFLDIVSKTINGQTKSLAMSSEDMWHKLASGDFTVDAQTKKQAQEDISENGYYGVQQTSQRLFDFAMALAGDDVEKMKKMQEAMQKGFQMAEKTWGREMPEITKQTIAASNKLFEDYFASKEVE